MIKSNLSFIGNLFSVSLSPKEIKNNALVISGCNAFIRDKNDVQIYSEMEEYSYSYLNNNDYIPCSMEIEICFNNSLKEPYHWFYAGCFSIRTDTGLTIKMNGKPNEKYLSKINIDNQIVVGIGFYFRDEAEYKLMLDSRMFIIEGFIALDDYFNTYGVSCKLTKHGDKWNIVYANTNQEKKKDDIRSKAD